jgi:hypothetical protein
MMMSEFRFCKDFIGEDRDSSVTIIAPDIDVHCVDELWEKMF